MNIDVDAFAQWASIEALDRFTDAVIAYLDQRLIGESFGKTSDATTPVQMDGPNGDGFSAKHLDPSSRKELAEAQV